MRQEIKDVLFGGNVVGDNVIVKGWVRTIRSQKQFAFLNVSDGSCFETLQIVADSALSNFESEILKLSSGCSVAIEGVVVASQGKGQKYELKATNVKVIGFVLEPENYPMSPKPHTVEHLRKYAHLRPRTNLGASVARVRQNVSFAIHDFFNKNGFYWIATPIITASDCEGAGEMFRVSTLDRKELKEAKDSTIYEKDFFGKESFLTVSGQLNAETYACALSKVYTFGPTFRAENSNTTRHLAEFWMVEPEVAFNDLQDNAILAENMLKHVVENVLNNCQSELSFFAQHVDKGCIARLEGLVKNSFVHLDYTKAIDVLEKSNVKFDYPISWGMDLQSEHERYLAEEYVKAPVVLMNYPKEIKAFYMRLNDDGKTVAAMDVLAPGIGEIIGGSQREERYELLYKRMLEVGLSPEHYYWYLDLRRYGSVPHAGFGLGLERLISYVTGVHNVRDVIPFPRTPQSIEF